MPGRWLPLDILLRPRWLAARSALPLLPAPCRPLVRVGDAFLEAVLQPQDLAHSGQSGQHAADRIEHRLDDRVDGYGSDVGGQVLPIQSLCRGIKCFHKQRQMALPLCVAQPRATRRHGRPRASRPLLDRGRDFDEHTREPGVIAASFQHGAPIDHHQRGRQQQQSGEDERETNPTEKVAHDLRAGGAGHRD